MIYQDTIVQALYFLTGLIFLPTLHKSSFIYRKTNADANKSIFKEAKEILDNLEKKKISSVFENETEIVVDNILYDEFTKCVEHKLYVGRNIFGYLCDLEKSTFWLSDSKNARVYVQLSYTNTEEKINSHNQLFYLSNSCGKDSFIWFKEDPQSNTLFSKSNGFTKIVYFSEKKLLAYLNNLVDCCHKFLTQLFKLPVDASFTNYIENDDDKLVFVRFVFTIDLNFKPKKNNQIEKLIKSICTILAIPCMRFEVNNQDRISFSISYKTLHRLVHFYKSIALDHVFLQSNNVPTKDLMHEWQDKKAVRQAFFLRDFAKTMPVEIKTNVFEFVNGLSFVEYNKIMTALKKIEPEIKKLDLRI